MFYLNAIHGFRKVFKGNDKVKSMKHISELKRIEDSIYREPLTAFRKDMEKVKSLPCPKISIGTSKDIEGKKFKVLQTIDNFFDGHSLIVGSSGSGKTFFVIKNILDLLTVHKGPIIIIDFKGEMFDLLVNNFLPNLLASVEDEMLNNILQRLIVINPFSDKFLPELHILKRNPAIPLKIQVIDVLSTFERTIESRLGIRQDVIMKYLLMLAIEQELTFPMLKDLLENPFFLEKMVSTSCQKEVKNYFNLRFKRENKSSVDSLLSRIDRLLFLNNSQLMLSAKNCLDFNTLFNNKITIINLGSPPYGCEDIARFWGTFVMTKIVRSIFHRSVSKNTLPAWICIDEWQNLLTREQADQMERILSMARFKRCFLTLICQQIEQISKISWSLPKITVTNTNKQIFFRSNLEDVKFFSHALPVTGRRPKPKRSIVDYEAKNRYYTYSEELRILTEEVAQLPKRYFYFFDKTKPYKAHLVKSAHLNLPMTEECSNKAVKYLKEYLQKGTLSLPIGLLKQVFEEREKEIQLRLRVKSYREKHWGARKNVRNIKPPTDGEGEIRRQKSNYPNLG